MTILSVKHLTKSYSDTSGIFDLSFDIEENDITLLLGPNGAGKTTAFNSILGLTQSNYETIAVNDTSIQDKAVFHEIGAMISKPSFYDYLTGYEHLSLLSSCYDITKDQVNHMFNLVGLEKAKDNKISTYSSGMKQKLDLARAIIHGPKLLILDEPFNGMDIEAKVEMKKILKEIQNKHHTGMIISSHMVGDLESFANKVIIIYEGRTLYNGSMSEINDSGLTVEEFYLEKLAIYKKKVA
ncbi:MAG: ABC transporter ATP-binding protein [Clostridiales bacterium]|nr:ABC transporter ATP-binding protein [Clostridiales bacterium]